MRIDLGAKVRTKDGHSAGHVEKAVWDPRANQITAFVITTGGLLGHEVVVSPEMLEGAARDGDEIVVGLTKKELGELARYDESEYSAPPADWVAPAVYAFPIAGYLWPPGYADAATPVVPPAAPDRPRARPGDPQGHARS